MRSRIMRLLTMAAVVLAVVSLASPAFAQSYTGRIEVSVEDSTGGRLPGVTVSLVGQMNQSTVTDARGEARFLNLAVGRYTVSATLAGFKEWKSAEITVAAGVSIPLAAKLGIAGATAQIEVTAEAPVLDNKKQTVGTNVSFEELQNVPTARDPWVVMQSVAGIVVDRVNVGGSESGQQSGFMGKGAASGDTTWNVDGMPITDMSSLSSPFYYDFDMFQEMNIVTGGSDPKSATGGIQMNFMLKSGSNNFHGSGKFYFENESMQGSNVPDNLLYLTNPVTKKGDRTNQFLDWGGELGGPVFKDRWWFWASYGKQDIRILKLSGATDRTVLPNLSAKTQGQITKALRGSFTYFMANKQKWGRNASSTRPQETTWNQDGPNSMYKGELNYVFGNNLFLVGRYAYVKGGFTFDPQAGMNKDVYMDEGGVWHGSYSNYITDRPQKAAVVDGNYFKGNHELKFGFTWRKTDVHSSSQWATSTAGQPIVTLYNQGSPTLVTAQVTAPFVSDGSSKYYSLYVGDTITLKRATINLGFRYDYQTSSVLPSKSEAVVGFEKYLPAVTAPGLDNVLTYKLIQPRVGMTYSLDESRKTQLRATYAMFTSQIGTGAASFMSVAQYRYMYYDAILPAGQKAAKLSNIVGGIGNYWDYGGFDPANPTASSKSIHQVGDYSIPKTNEFILGLDRELMPNFGVSASYTFRHIGSQNWRPIRKVAGGVVTGADYVKLGTLTGQLPSGFDGANGGTYNAAYYGITNTALYNSSKGTIFQERPGYTQRYQGFDISATKRMSNRWMARVGLSTNSWREYFANDAAKSNPGSTLGAPNIDGGYVVSASGGSGKSGIYMVQPKYQAVVNGAYQLPYKIDLGISYLIRQGYPMPWFQATPKTGNVLAQTQSILLVPDFGQDRLPNTQTLDMRIGKTLKMGRVTANIDFDVFNVLNSATPLGRQYDKSKTSVTTGYTQALELMQPRIGRIGVRIGF